MYRCPLCHLHSFSIEDLTKHLAMERDEDHVKWRREHGLPEDYENGGEVAQTKRKIKEMIEGNETKDAVKY